MKNEYNELLRKQKMGGSSIRFSQFAQCPSTHTELIYHVTKFDAVYFSEDPNLYNEESHDDSYPTHASSPILQALFLQKIHEKVTHILLPLFEYSGIHHFIKERTYSDEAIIHLWVDMCSAYIKKELETNSCVDFPSLELIKIESMYGSIENYHAKCNAPADICYDESLREQIDAAIIKEQNHFIAKYEEELLIKFFPNDYPKYKLSTYIGIPFC